MQASVIDTLSAMCGDISADTSPHTNGGLSYVVMLQFTEDLDFSECPNAGEKRLEHAGDLFQRSSTASARVHH